MPTPGNIWVHNKLQNKLVYGRLGNCSYFQFGSQTYEQENCQQQTMGRGYCSHTSKVLYSVHNYHKEEASVHRVIKD